jgi:hypothetical protein
VEEIRIFLSCVHPFAAVQPTLYALILATGIWSNTEYVFEGPLCCITPKILDGGTTPNPSS